MRTDTLERVSLVAITLLDDEGFMFTPNIPWPSWFTMEDSMMAGAMAHAATLMATAKWLDEDPTDLFEKLQDFITNTIKEEQAHE